MDEKIKAAPKRLPRALEQELKKAALGRPSWESRNEGIHERVNFDDTIWGFNLAGGAYYDTPLRVTEVKEESRAEHAGIKVGDVLTSINEIDTSTLTVQQAHDIILSSGLEIKLACTAPDVEETTHYVYQDELEEDLRQIRRLRDLKIRNERRKFNGAKTNEAWSLAWPCSKKRDIMYKESNCYLVPSAYTAKHPDKIKTKSINTGDKNVISIENVINEVNAENGLENIKASEKENEINHDSTSNGLEHIISMMEKEMKQENIDTDNSIKTVNSAVENKTIDENIDNQPKHFISLLEEKVKQKNTEKDTDNGTIKNNIKEENTSNGINNITGTIEHKIHENSTEKESKNIIDVTGDDIKEENSKNGSEIIIDTAENKEENTENGIENLIEEVENKITCAISENWSKKDTENESKKTTGVTEDLIKEKNSENGEENIIDTAENIIKAENSEDEIKNTINELENKIMCKISENSSDKVIGTFENKMIEDNNVNGMENIKTTEN